MTDVQAKRKIAVGARITYVARELPSRPSSPTKPARPPSPSKRLLTLATLSPTPLPRPRAKVSSSASVAAGRKPVGNLTPGYASGTSTPRAPSPVKHFDSPQGRLSPRPSSTSLSRVRLKANVPAASAPSSPLVGNYQPVYPTLSTAVPDSEVVRPSPPRIRHASISSMSQLSSMSSARANGVLSPASSVVSCSQESDVPSSMTTKRIKAKVTGLAKGKPPVMQILGPSAATLLNASPVPSPNTAQSQPYQRIGRTASVSSLASANEPSFYPITTSSPAANSHRFATMRAPSGSRRLSQCFSSPLQSGHTAHVDPYLVPLPPHSPPSSIVSFSSHSSASRSSLSSVNHSTVPVFSINVNGTLDGVIDHGAKNSQNNCNSRPRSGSLIIHDNSEADSEEAEEERTIKAEAKSIRKIADLEITNESLLAINVQLEANKHKQAKEIRELRRKLRESRLILPPRTYRALELSSSAKDIRNEEEEEEEEEQEQEGEVGDTSAEIIKLGKDDELFNRVRGMLDNLLETGRQALQSRTEDFAPPKGIAKVLHEEEARSWRDGEHSSDSGLRTPADRDPGDETFDETFVTAESGDEADGLYGYSRRVSFAVKKENTNPEGLVHIMVGEPESPLATAYI